MGCMNFSEINKRKLFRIIAKSELLSKDYPVSYRDMVFGCPDMSLFLCSPKVDTHSV